MTRAQFMGLLQGLRVLVLVVGHLGSMSCAHSERHERGPEWDDFVRRQTDRTSFDSWREHEFELAGVTAEVPVDAWRVWDSIYDAYIAMHIYSPGFPAEPQPLLEVTLDRMSLEEFREAQSRIKMSNLFQESDEVLRQYLIASREQHSEIKRFLRDRHVSFRYDVACADGTIIKGSAQLYYRGENGTPTYLEEDEKAIRRLLSSVKCLPKQAVGPSAPDGA